MMRSPFHPPSTRLDNIPSADTNPHWAGDEAQRNDRSRSHAGATRHVSDGVHGNGDND